MFTKVFVKDTLERALSTASQTALALLSVEGLNLATFDWQGLLVASGVAFVASVLKSVAAHNMGDGSASLVK